MADTPLVNLTIEGRPVAVAPGTTILEAAKSAGVLIPHYCYHPGLPVAGVCRMCLVEVEKFPKLAPSCATAVAEGQVVHVHSEKAREARKGVLEMLLINHPLDCPICDQSGECELQDYTYQEGRKDSRYREPKRFNPVDDFGGDVLYVQNRCILCTRCVRFMDDVARDTVLNVSERGDRAFIGKFEGRTSRTRGRPMSSTCVRLAHSSRRTSSTRRVRGSSTARRRCAPDARRGATSSLRRATTR
ncbi:MAG: 2Fe-2S iron-sulfur cluster-binding protein [Gemmatimonadaceae bacterium]